MQLPDSRPASRRIRHALAGAAAALVLGLAGAVAWGVAWGIGEERGETAGETRPVRPMAAPQQPAAIPATVPATVNGEAAITLSEAAQRDDGIAVFRLTESPHRRELQAYGTVVDLRPLTDLDNRYDNAKAQLDIAQAKLAASQTAYERARALFGANKVISAAQYQTAEASYLVDRATLAGARSQLHSLEASAVQDWGPVLGRAVIEDKPVVQRLIARRLVLLQATLPAGERLFGQPTGAAAQADDGTLVPLDFVSEAPRTDPRLQGLSFYFTAPADSGLLPGMNVVVLVPKGAEIDSVVLPESAVVWEGGQPWAYFSSGPNTFTRRPIATDWRATGGGYVVEGVADGAEVVTRGAQMLLSDEFRAQIKAGASGDQDND